MPFLASCQERGREGLAVGLGGGGQFQACAVTPEPGWPSPISG